MKWSEWLEEWGMSNLKINIGFAQMEFKPQDADRDAAWEMYIELLTRITTQILPAGHGDEEKDLAKYTAMLGKMAGVEDDLLLLEQVSDQS